MRQMILDTIMIHRRLLEQFERDSIEVIPAAADLVVKTIREGGCVYLCGNGGSAADAQHVAGELVGRFTRERKGFAAVALTTDTSVITSVANDYEFENIFARQAEALIGKGDLLWAFSTSGTSKNILKAVDVSRLSGASILGFTGKPNTPLEKLSDVCLAVDAPTAASAQEIHQLGYHLICDLVEMQLTRD
jgi:D-sedoheptulose 7-phosphate isomerase